jgi:primary-amine oxidase
MNNKITHKTGLALLALLPFYLFSSLAEARPNSGTCPAGHTISKTFSSGAAWDMCWQVRDEEGMVLSEVHYKPVGKPRRRVLGEAGLSQIQVEYDDGSPTEFVITGSGLGGSHLQTLNSSMCDGQLHKEGGRNVICEEYGPAGYIYRYKNNIRRQGSKLDVYSVSAVGAREYIIRWTFLENGTIEPAVGLTGQFTKTTTNAKAGWKVTAQNKIATSFVHHYFWRLDFDIAANSSNDIIEQIKSVPSSTRLTKTKQTRTISSELADSFTPAEKKFWRIRDESVKNSSGKSISYEMVMLNYAEQNKGNSASPWLKNDVFFTRYNACERFAVENPSNNCGANVSEFVNSESTNAKDIVVWYRLTHHTLPRDEDFSPAAPQWSTFILLPRDWTSTTRL